MEEGGGGTQSQLVAGYYTSHLGPVEGSPSTSPLINCVKPNHKEGLSYCLNTLVFCGVGVLARASSDSGHTNQSGKLHIVSRHEKCSHHLD